MNRREFSRKAIIASTGIITFPYTVSFARTDPAKRKLKKGIMWGSIGVGETISEKFISAKEAGFEGVEVMSHLSREEVLKASKGTGLAIPSVCSAMHGKFPLSHPDPDIRAEGLKALKTTIEDADIYGAETVLLIPGRVNEEVAYDECWKRSIEEIKKAIPMAEKLKVEIAFENVGNNFLLSPLEAVQYVDQFGSEFIKFYFDCGNVLHIGWPEQWIKILGKRISKVHIKEYSKRIADIRGRRAGFDVKLTEGDVNWTAVMNALDETGYSGWTTIEQPGGNTLEGLKDLCLRLGKIHDF